MLSTYWAAKVLKKQWGAIYLFQEDWDGVYHHSRRARQSLHHIGEGARCMIHLQKCHTWWTAITLFSHFKCQNWTTEYWKFNGWIDCQVIDSLQFALIGLHNVLPLRKHVPTQYFLILTISKLCSICNSVICKEKTRGEQDIWVRIERQEWMLDSRHRRLVISLRLYISESINLRPFKTFSKTWTSKMNTNSKFK